MSDKKPKVPMLALTKNNLLTSQTESSNNVPTDTETKAGTESGFQYTTREATEEFVIRGIQEKN